MKRRLRVLAVAGVAALSVGAVTAASAQADAPSWLVGGTGTFLGTGATKEIKTTNTVAPKLETPALGATISCTSSSATGKIVGNAAANGAGTGKEVVVTYKGCTVIGFPDCTVRSSAPNKPAGEIATNKLKGTLVWLAAAGNSDGFLLQPEAGNFTTLVFEGELCALPEAPLGVTGAVIGKAEPQAGEPEAVVGNLNFPAAAITKYWEGGAARVERNLNVAPAPNRLALGGNASTYVGKEKIELTSGEKWGTKAH